MTSTPEITAYVGASYSSVAAALAENEASILEEAARATVERIAAPGNKAAPMTAPTLITRPGKGDETNLRIVDTRDLAGATVALAGVGGPKSGLTEMTLQLASPFGRDGEGGKQLLAAATFVSASAARLTSKVRSAA
ncbi:MAG: hypothetical protein ACE5GC_03970 [Acidimicrobiia bacterium]